MTKLLDYDKDYTTYSIMESQEHVKENSQGQMSLKKIKKHNRLFVFRC